MSAMRKHATTTSDGQSEDASSINVITRPDRHPLESGTEIRVHGVGDHAAFSALGKPGFEDRRKSQVVICDAPPLPRHRLLLVGWSRANRKLTRTLVWYLLFPFTLINVAGYMAPRHRASQQLLQRGVQITSLLLTVALAAWVTVIVETVWRGMTDAPDGWLIRLLLSCSGPAVVGAVIAKRLWKGDRAVDRAGGQCSAVHLGALALVAAVCTRGPAGWSYSVLDHSTPWRSAEDLMVDPMAYVIYGSTCVVLIVALLLTTAAVLARSFARDKWSLRESSALAAAALLLLFATVVLHAGGSLLRLFASQLTGLVQDVRHQAATGVASAGHILLPVADDLTEALRMDLLLGFVVALALILGTTVLVASVVNGARGGRLLVRDPALRPVSVWHRTLRYAPACLSIIAFATVLATIVIWGTMCFALNRMEPGEVALARRVFSVFGTVLIVFLIVRRPERAGEWVKSIFEMVADIAGFWTPRWAPLAGASYRSVITDALDAAVEESEPGPITLVGHSQGSVICAWYVSRLDRSQDRITLFTCGSPLRSLYSTFFPEYFGHEFFESVAATSKAGQWYNYWRLTDPIATALPDAHNRDLTERADQPLRGHGEYWQEPLMRADVDGVLGVGVAERSVPLEPA
jgi:hypothetical protein